MQEYRHTLIIFNTYCSSTAKVVTRRRLCVTLYVQHVVCLVISPHLDPRRLSEKFSLQEFLLNIACVFPNARESYMIHPCHTKLITFHAEWDIGSCSTRNVLKLPSIFIILFIAPCCELFFVT